MVLHTRVAIPGKRRAHRSNVPGVALYFYTLSSIRTELSYLPFFQSTNIPTAAQSTTNTNRSTLVKLSVPGNLIAGAIARTSVGFILNPITVLKARYEVSLLLPARPLGQRSTLPTHGSNTVDIQSSQFQEYKSIFGAFKSLLQTNGVKGLFQGFTATAVRDAPYAGMSIVFYEKAKDLSCAFSIESLSPS